MIKPSLSQPPEQCLLHNDHRGPWLNNYDPSKGPVLCIGGSWGRGSFSCSFRRKSCQGGWRPPFRPNLLSVVWGIMDPPLISMRFGTPWVCHLNLFGQALTDITQPTPLSIHHSLLPHVTLVTLFGLTQPLPSLHCSLLPQITLATLLHLLASPSPSPAVTTLSPLRSHLLHLLASPSPSPAPPQPLPSLHCCLLSQVTLVTLTGLTQPLPSLHCCLLPQVTLVTLTGLTQPLPGLYSSFLPQVTLVSNQDVRHVRSHCVATLH